MFQPLDEAGRKLTEEMVGDAQTWFLGLVANRRKLDPSSIPGLAQGRIFSGRQAVGFKLVDALGSETDAVTWMESTRGVRKGLRIVDWKVGGSTASGFFSSVAQRFLGLSMDGWLQNVADSPHFSALQLDGLVSVWHRPQN
jgi:protease-4